MSERLSFDLAVSDPAIFKGCCTAVYESAVVRYLLGDSWHPGGVRLTLEIGETLGLSAQARLLDVACGIGESARALARRFGCKVVGTDLSPSLLEAATQATKAQGLDRLVNFEVGDAEALPFPSGRFDALLCECALCTFPNKSAAAKEMARVLKPGGRLAVADILLEPPSRAGPDGPPSGGVSPGPLPQELSSLLSRILCVAAALPLAGYASLLADAGLQLVHQEDCRWAATEFLRAIDRRLFMARIAQSVGRFAALEGLDIKAARRILASVRSQVDAGCLSYGYIIAQKD